MDLFGFLKYRRPAKSLDAETALESDLARLEWDMYAVAGDLERATARVMAAVEAERKAAGRGRRKRLRRNR